MSSRIIFLLASVYLIECAATNEDLPCIRKWQEAGQSYQCVCNSTYCDTINRPDQSNLASGSYFYYKTSNSTPGFNKVVGNFIANPPVVLDQVTFTINTSVTYQEIVGFGGSVTDSMGSVLLTLPEAAQEKLLESYFGSTGIEYNMLRIPIGSTDFSTTDYTLDDVPGDDSLTYFNLNDADYNYKIPVIKRIIEKSKKDIKIIACTWVAPTWMKDGDCPYNTFLKSEYQDAWARYHVKFVQAYEAEGVNIWALSSSNEPVLIYMVPQGFLNFTNILAPQQRDWLKNYLKPQLVANNYSDIKFFAMEDCRPFANYFMDRFGNDAEALAALDGIALHTYFDWFWPATEMDRLHYKYPDKLILYTEASINDEFGWPALVFGSWNHSAVYLTNSFENLNHYAQSYIDWNLALNTEGGPSRSEALDCAVLINETSGEFYKQPMFYAMGHLSKFILPGAKRVEVTSSQDSNTTVTKKLNKDLLKSKLLSTVTGHGVSLQILIPAEVTCLAFTNPDDSFTVMVLNTMNRTIPVNIVDSRVGTISLNAEEQSINTFIYWPPSTKDSLSNS